MLFFKLSSLWTIIKFFEDLDFNHSLEHKFSFIFDNFNCVLCSFGQIDALDNLAKRSLTQVLHNFVPFVFRRNDYLILFEHIFSATSETNFFVLVSLVSLTILSIPFEFLLKEIIIQLNVIIIFIETTVII